MQTQFETIETLKARNSQLVEIELMLTPNELKTFADYCLKNEIKFNDWIRRLGYDALEEKTYKCKVIGKVQGVYYRANVQKAASEAHFSGYVKNMPDGSVEACVTCKEDAFEDFMKILRQGSPNSRVDEVLVSNTSKYYSDVFEILV